MSAIFEKHPEYREYNKVTVTLITNGNKKTIISNVNKKGLPDQNCGAHFVSLTVEPPAFDSGDASNCGAKGTVTVVDYKDAVFNILTGHFTDFLKNQCNLSDGSNLENASIPANTVIQQDKLLPGIIIEIHCFIGPPKIYTGHILDWSTQFVGTTPNINLNWSVILPSDIDPSLANKPEPTLSNSALAYYNGIAELYDKENKLKVKIQNDSGEWSDLSDIDNILTINNAAQGQPASCGNKLIDALQLICASGTYTLDNKPCAGFLDGDTFRIVKKSTGTDSDVNTISKKVIFIQNGKYPAYYEHFKDSDNNEKIVIPMTSFSFDTDFKKLATQFSIIENPNGNKLTGGSEPSTDTADGEQAKAQLESKTKDAGQGAITVKFDCYNIMALDQYNLSSEIHFLVFNEFGKKHITSGKAIITKVTYDLSGAVVKASIEATQVFNSIIGEPPSKVAVGDMQFTVQPKPVAPGNGSNPSNPSPKKSGNPTKHSKNPDLVAYLRTEDKKPIPLSADKTSNCIINGTFKTHVDEFLNKYGDLTGTSKLLDGAFVQKLINAGNFGLLTLIIGAGNYGIKNYNDFLTGDNAWAIIDDPVNLYKGLDTKFCASNTGKNPYDHKTGGLGMPHWDAENLKDIYTTHGFDPDISDDDKKHFESLLIADYPDPLKRPNYDGKISKWKIGKCILDKTITRCFPVFSGKVYIRRFDKGLKQDAKWLEWARKILYYRGDGDNRVYQYDLFNRWIIKFWNPTMAKLKTTKAESGHTICLQDAIRISRAGSSATGLINDMVGRNVSQQYDIYYGGEDRYDRQKAFCRRLCDIVGYALSN